jgi:hypothetical protein
MTSKSDRGIEVQCPKCSAENPPNSRFCNSCGEPFSSVSQMPTMEAPEAESLPSPADVLHGVLKNAGFGQFEKVIITCVDPDYPVRSLGKEFECLDVSYTSDNEQCAQTATARLDLRFWGHGGFSSIDPEDVHELLGVGVVQLSQVDSVVVLGIPGDVYAFYPKGTGFGFGNPYAIRPDESRQLLHSLAVYGHASEVIAMMHPDCMLIANNEGKYQTYTTDLVGPFPSSSYGVWEMQLKQNAAESLRTYVQNTLNLRFRLVSPVYVARRPVVLKTIGIRGNVSRFGGNSFIRKLAVHVK